ncbi:hypothetical protein AQ621_17110 (plasmid) [Marinobacter sp. P4B1]|nr:hypothetical protein AQ621_17110 [Marinobacter sp. P4B1]
MDKENSVVLWRTIAVVILAVVVVGGFTAGFSYQFYEPGERWDRAMNHIGFGLIGGPILVLTVVSFHFVNAYRKHRLKKGQE